MPLYLLSITYPLAHRQRKPRIYRWVVAAPRRSRVMEVFTRSHEPWIDPEMKTDIELWTIPVIPFGC